MRNWPHLKNAPLMEAVLDIRAIVPQEGIADKLQKLRDRLQGQFPNCKKRIIWEAQLKPTDENLDIDRKGGHDGYILTSEDGLTVSQVHSGGLALSRLKPYTSWNALTTEARSLWSLYCDYVKPVTITRLSTRYINRLELPLPFNELRSWLLTVPEIAPTLPQTLTSYLMRLVIPFDGEITAVVTQAIPPGPYSNNTAPIVLDIDVHRVFDKPAPCDETAMWGLFEDIRDVKNRIFFETITRKTEELYR